MTQFIGHFHPLLVHLPIGILLLAFVLECLSRWLKQDQLQQAIRWSVQIGLIAALFSIISGWCLAEEGGYDDRILQQHRWFGIGTTGLFVLVWFLQSGRWYFPVFSAGVLALVATGHFGGSLTHGVGYLFEKESFTPNVGVFSGKQNDPETPVFTGIIQPILQEKCVSCHRPGKRKGDLVLSSQDGILLGGKHGKVLIPGNPDSSNLLQRIHLPLPHEDHMPPSGKPQLSALEIRLLEWWIASGADFHSLVKNTPMPADLSAALSESSPPPANPVFSIPVSMPSSKALQRLKSLNIKVQTLGEGQPWLAVSMAGQQEISQEHWQLLEAISAQLSDLDLSHTAIQDKDLSRRSFPHLASLNLSHTKVGAGVIPFFEKSPFLESINLTNTNVGNELEGVLSKLPQLKKLFVWQTQTTPESISNWQKQYPGLKIETGATIANDAPLTLRSPKLLYSRSFFDDTMQLELDFPFKGIEIYYTLDEAASPTTQSPRYREKIVLDKTSHLRAFAAKEGWQNSPVVEAVFVKKKFTISAATLSKPPSPKYPAKGAASLIDGKIADAQGADTWLGFEGEHLEAILDLGESKEIGHVFVHCLENNSPWIFKPAGIQVSTSVDGKNFQPQTTEKFAQNTSMGEQKVHLLGCHFPKITNARYVRVHVQSPLKNPVWHPGKGQKCWIFIDEITVE